MKFKDIILRVIMDEFLLEKMKKSYVINRLEEFKIQIEGYENLSILC